MSASGQTIVSLRDVGKTFERGTVALEALNLEVREGEFVSLLGPSGCGKTTLLRFIGGQLYPDAGQVLVENQNIPDMSRKELFVARAKIGMLFQSGALFSDLSVYLFYSYVIFY